MESKNTNEEIEIDLKELFAVLLGKFWIICMAGIGLALAVFLISKFALEPKYESTTKIYVLNKQDSTSTITYSDLQSGSQLTKDYMTLVTSRPVTEQVIAELDLDMRHEDMVKIISVDNPSDTRILNITVEYNDPFLAKQIADAIREAAAVHITTVMDIEQVNVVEEANIPESPSSPNVMRNAVIGGVVGIFLASFAILLIYMIDDTIKTPDDIERYLDISVLSSIPIQESMKNAGNKKKTKKAAKQKKNNKSKEPLKPNLDKL